MGEAKPYQFEWTGPREDLLRDMHAAGASFSAIATALGGYVTRSAISGKVARMGLPSRGTGNCNKPGPRRRTVKRGSTYHVISPRHALHDPGQVIAAGTVEGGLTFDDVTDRNLCAWAINSPPLGHANDLRFCGASRAGDGGRYCADHRLAAADPSRKVRADRQARAAVAKAKREGVA